MKVLYVDSVGPFGGASRSLFEVVRPLTTNGEVQAYFVMQEGSAARFYEQLAKGIVTTRGMSRFDNTRFSHYRGIRWLILLREIIHAPFMLNAMFRAKKIFGKVDLIHVNEAMDIIPGLCAQMVFGAPMVVHVRSLQWENQNAWRTRWVNARLSEAAAVVAINMNTRLSMPPSVPVTVIQNSFTPKKAPTPDTEIQRRLSGLRQTSLKVGFVGNLHVSKGLFELLDAARQLVAAGRDLEFLIVGSVTRTDTGLRAWLLNKAGLAQNIEAEVHDYVKRHRLEQHVHLLGHTNDIQTVYEHMHVIAFPSYYDAPGRPVFEAAFSSVPCIVCVDNPQPDTVISGTTGITVPAKDAKSLAAAIAHFESDRTEVTRMGRAAKQLAEENFVPEKNAAKLLDVYRRALKSA